MIDFLWFISVPVLVLSFAGIAYLVESRGKCRHQWTRWDDPENTGVHVIQRRACEKCNLQESRVMIANATISEKEDVAVPPAPTDTVDKETAA